MADPLTIDIVGGSQGGYGGGSPVSSAASGAAAGTAIAPGWGTVIGAGVGLLGGMFSNSSAKRAAEANRKWLEYMSSTAHQREVADLRAAGLNPILSATGGAGASTPGSSAADVTDIGAAALSGASSATQTKRAVESFENEQENLKQDTALKAQTVKTQDATAKAALSSAHKTSQETSNLVTSGKILKEELTRAQTSAKKASNMGELEDTDFGKVMRWMQMFMRAIKGGE